jgi:hypothetical protein
MSKPRFFEEEPVPDRSQAPLSAWERAEFPPPPNGPEWRHHRLKPSVRLTDVYSQRRADVLDVSRALERYYRGGEKENEAPSPEGEGRLLEELKRFLEEFQNRQDRPQEEAAPSNRRTRKQPIRTPRSDAPLIQARPAERLRPERAKGRLYFSCPCCHFPAALPVWLAGKKARCPRCYSAIRAPHPRKGLHARSLENDVASLLHPERFSEYRNAHRLVPWLGVPRPKLFPSVHAGALVVLFVVFGFFVSTMAGNVPRRVAPIASSLQAPHPDAPDFNGRARRIVEQFLAAESIEGRTGLVRDSQRVAPLMTDWYQRHPEQLKTGGAEMEVSPVALYPGSGDQWVSGVHIAAADGSWEQIFTVEHDRDGDRIEWESSVGYNPDLSELISGGAEEPRTIRVEGCLDNYYNFQYANAETHLCVRLHDPATLKLLGYGYIAVDREDAESIASYLDGAGQDELRPLMIEVRPGSDTSRTHQVEIVRMVEAGWRNDRVMAGIPGKSTEQPN